MRRILLCVGLALALAIPAGALAATKALFGELDGHPDSTVKIRTASGNDGVSVKSFAVKDFDVSCEDGATVALKRVKLTGRIPVGDKGGFSERDDNGETVFKIRGELKRDGKRATGTFRHFGSLEGQDGAVHECDSGRLSWTAKR
jgi:hypothetical protein